MQNKVAFPAPISTKYYLNVVVFGDLAYISLLGAQPFSVDIMVTSCGVIEYTKVKVTKPTSDFAYRLSSVPVAQLTRIDTV